jgi:hypothetical protein
MKKKIIVYEPRNSKIVVSAERASASLPPSSQMRPHMYVRLYKRSIQNLKRVTIMRIVNIAKYSEARETKMRGKIMIRSILVSGKFD